MKTIKTYLSDNSIVAFKVYGGGGNNRKVKCLGEHMIGDFTDDLFEQDGEYVDESGNSVELTAAEVESGVGRINRDFDYDTIYTCKLRDIDYTDEEAWAMAHSELPEEWVVGYFCNGEDEENARYIIGELGLDADDYMEEDEE